MVKFFPIDIDYKDRTRRVFIPDDGDKEETDALIEIEKEKTLNELKNMPEKIRLSDRQKEDAAEALKDYKKYKNRQRETPNKRYF